MNAPPPPPVPPSPPLPSWPAAGNQQKTVAAGMRVLKIVGWVCALLGVAMLLFGVFFLQEGYRSASWPSVEGEVVKAGVRVHTSVNTRRSVSTSRGRQYYAEVTYRYQVDGQSYTSRRYALGESQEMHNERDDAIADALRFPTGMKLPVYYDPGDPSSAVLETGAGIGAWMPLLLSFLFLGLGVALILAPTKIVRRAQAA